MESVSGKFASKPKHSTFVAEEVKHDVTTLSRQIPPLPARSRSKSENVISEFLEDYFGRFWWLWIVVLLILKIKKT